MRNMAENMQADSVQSLYGFALYRLAGRGREMLTFAAVLFFPPSPCQEVVLFGIHSKSIIIQNIAGIEETKRTAQKHRQGQRADIPHPYAESSRQTAEKSPQGNTPVQLDKHHKNMYN